MNDADHLFLSRHTIDIALLISPAERSGGLLFAIPLS